MPYTKGSNAYEKLLSQSLILDAIYYDEFGHMTFEEIRNKTRLAKESLTRNLEELCADKERELDFYFRFEDVERLVEEENKKYDLVPDLPRIAKSPEEALRMFMPNLDPALWKLVRRRVVRHPILLKKGRIYKLHRITRQALDYGLYPWMESKKRLPRLTENNEKS